MDVPKMHPYIGAIYYVENNGIVSGYPDGTFRPDDIINRVEFTKIIVESLWDREMIDKCGTHYFEDVPRDSWFHKYVCRARDGWLITGYPDGTFRPSDSINFVEAAKILSNGFNLIERLDHCSGKLCPDVDTPEHPWYEQYVSALSDQSAIPPSIVSNDSPITRGEMAEMIYRLR